jgi:hypothetical protein
MEGGFSSNLRHQECVRQSLEQGAPDHRDWVIIDRGPAGWRQAIGTGRLIVMTDGKRRRGTSTQV